MYRVGSGELLRVCKAFLCVGSLDLGEVHSAKVPQAQPLPLQHPSGAASPSPLKGCVVLQPRSVLSDELGTAGELAPGSAAETVTESEGCTKMALCCFAFFSPPQGRGAGDAEPGCSLGCTGEAACCVQPAPLSRSQADRR